MANVLVLHASLDSVPQTEAFGALRSRLSYGKRRELEWLDASARRRSLAGIALVLRGIEILRGTPAAAPSLMFPAGEKPYLPGGPRFSISHAGTHVGVAVSANCEVGFDLEEVTGRSERAAGPEDATSLRERLLQWTATEAVLKAAGRGLREAKLVQLDDALANGRIGMSQFRLTRVEIPGDVVACLATDVGPVTVSVQEAVLSGATS